MPVLANDKSEFRSLVRFTLSVHTCKKDSEAVHVNYEAEVVTDRRVEMPMDMRIGAFTRAPHRAVLPFSTSPRMSTNQRDDPTRFWKF